VDSVVEYRSDDKITKAFYYEQCPCGDGDIDEGLCTMTGKILCITCNEVIGYWTLKE